MASTAVDLALLERWLCGWSLARGAPLPRREGGALVVEVGEPDQLRRHVYASADAAFREWVAQISAPRIHVKAAVDAPTMRAALAPHWQLGEPRYLMRCAAPMLPSRDLPPGFTLLTTREHGALVIHVCDPAGEPAASGRVVLRNGTAVFDRIDTLAPYRRRGLASALMLALDALAVDACVAERLLVATEAGRALYASLGWEVVSPYSSALIPAAGTDFRQRPAFRAA